jgi:flagellar basal body-associated protein FliL
MEEQEEKKSSGAWIWILVILILLAVGIGAYFWLTGDSSPIANSGSAGISAGSIPQPPALPN